MTLNKVWVTLITCAASRAIILDLVPGLDAHSFIKCFRRFVSRKGCPNFVISDGGKNFVSVETQNFVNNMGVDWRVNLPLAPWHGGFFERLVRSTKSLLRKQLQTQKLSYEELQTVLFEIETILNNRRLTYYYTEESETCLTPNHMLFGRTLQIICYLEGHYKSYVIWKDITNHMLFGRTLQIIYYLEGHYKSYVIWKDITNHVLFGRTLQIICYLEGHYN